MDGVEDIRLKTFWQKCKRLSNQHLAHYYLQTIHLNYRKPQMF